MKSIVLPAVTIMLGGSILALGFNSVRTDVRIKLNRNYFKIAEHQTSVAGQQTGEDPSGTHPKHPYTVAALDDMIDMIGSEAQYNGDVVVVDARSDEDYAEEHLPRALHIDNYNVDKNIEEVRPYLESAETIVVYCGGGDCEDSIFLASELEARGIPSDRLRIFEGGLKAWREAALPLESSADELGFTQWSQAEFDDQGSSTP